MKKFASVVAISMLSAGTSFAADLPVKARPAPPPVVAPSWTGCYLGGGGGYGMFNQKRDVIATLPNFSTLGASGPNSVALGLVATPGAVVTPNETFGGEGWLATVQGGCDYQFATSGWGNWVIGAFADADWDGLRGDRSLLGFNQGQEQMRWSWAVGARLGWVVTPYLLTYVSGGFTQAQFDGVNYGTSSINVLNLTTSQVSLGLATTGQGLQIGSRTQNGWFIGGGTEYALGWLPGLFWKNEYRYADYGNTTQNVICTVCTAVAGGPLGATGLAERTKTTVQTFRTELVWRFNWAGGPVVAKY